MSIARDPASLVGAYCASEAEGVKCELFQNHSRSVSGSRRSDPGL
jgi:hypothetical protein